MRLVLFAAAYFGCAAVGNWLTIKPGPFVAFWMPGGLFVAVLLIHPTRQWAYFVAAAAVGNVAFDLSQDRLLQMSLLFTTGNCLEALAGASMVRRFVSAWPTLATLREVTGLVVLAGLVAPVLSATVGALTVGAFDTGAWNWQTWALWWSGDVLGVFLTAPLIFVWRPGGGSPGRWKLTVRHIEPLVTFAAILASAMLLFGRWGYTDVGAKFLLMPLVLWMSMRGGQRGATAANIAVAIIAAYFTMVGSGEIAGEGLSPAGKDILLHMFLASVCFVGLIPATLLRQRLETEDALRDSQRRLQQAVEAGNVGLWDWDLRTNRVSFSPEWKRQIGYEENEISDDFGEWSKRVHPDDLAGTMEKVRAFMDGVSPVYEAEFRFRHKDGSYRLILAQGTLERDALGKPVCMLGTHVDITRLRLAEEKLAQSQRMEAIGQLAGGVAHEFRNQLTVVLGYGEMLQRRGLVREEGRRMLEEILRAGQRSATTAGHLLAFGRREMLHPQTWPLCDIVAGLGQVLAHVIGEHISLVLVDEADGCRARVDRGIFEQAIMNLATNARDAMPEGGQITIETKRVTVGADARADLPPGAYALVSVTDTGTGMDEQTLARVFEPFFTTKPVGKGTGLGLPMVYGFAKQSGGTVEIVSRPGVGTTVRLYLPAVAAAAQPPSPAAPAPGGRETVLVVEDEESVRHVVVQALRDAGYRVLEAGGVGDALPLAVQTGGGLDLLITDVVMPGTSGPVLAAQVARACPAVRVLYISGYPGEQLREHGLSGSEAWLVKPFSHDVLLRRVREALDVPAPRV